MSRDESKAEHLMGYVDLERPELAGVAGAERPAEALVRHLARPPRPRHRFEFEQKAEMLDFLKTHYEAWRSFETGPADRIGAMSLDAARGPRALAGVAALGKAWWATGNPGYGRAFERFYLETPTGGMFNWDNFNGTQGALELDAYYLLLDCDGFGVPGRIAFLDHLCAIAGEAWDRHTSTWAHRMLGPEGHNWYLHGMRVLPFLGLQFPEFRRAAFFARTGWSVVEEHVRGHYRDDGGARETTLGYQAGSMHNLWDFYLVAQRNGWPVSPGFADRVLHATKFLLRLMTPDGGLPSFGDGGHAPGGLTALAAVAAALTGDGECKWFAERIRGFRSGVRAEIPGQIPESAFWTVGLAGARAYAESRLRDPGLRSVLMGPTGYAALRGSDGADAPYLAVAAADRGPIVTSHGHNDLFSLEVHAGGRRFIGEMGCAPYGNSPGRLYDQRTEAHTGLTVDGLEQAPLINEWRWGGLVIPAVRRWIGEETHDFFHGVHEGFYRHPDRHVLHARKILFLRGAPACWIVLDVLDADADHDYAAYFHGVRPGRIEGGGLRLGEAKGPELAVLPPAGEPVRVERAENEGWRAYVAEQRLDPARYPCFVFRRRAAAAVLPWVLAPLAPGAPAPVARRLPARVNGRPAAEHEVTALEIAWDGAVDRICVSHLDYDAGLAFGGFEAWGILAFARSAGGVMKQIVNHVISEGRCGR